MSHRRKSERSLRRRAPQIDQRSRFVILCEGTLTEPHYLKTFARLSNVRTLATLDIRGLGFEPRKLVEEARNVARQERRQESGSTQYWCVFDVESPKPHPRLLEAVQMAQDNGIHLAVSNPCFELWLLLHYIDHESWLDNGTCRAIRHKQDGSQGKSLDSSAYMQQLAEAIQRSKRLDMLHEHAGRKLPENNPSSGMYRLLEAIDPSLSTDKRS